MSEYEYVRWSQYIFNKIVGDSKPTKEMIDEYFENVKHPQIEDYLDYQLHQYQTATLSGVDDYRWNSLKNTAITAKEAYLTGDADSVCMAFINLGRTIEAFEHPTRDERLEMTKASLQRHKSKWPLKEKQLEQECLSAIARNIAEEKWKKDEDKEIRLGDMTQEVYAELYVIAKKNNLLKYFPESGSLKTWLRDVAPEYAKKAGRPKKK